MTNLEIEATLGHVQETMLQTIEALQLARAKIAVLETENELLKLALDNAKRAEGERIYQEFEKRWPAARRSS